MKNNGVLMVSLMLAATMQHLARAEDLFVGSNDDPMVISSSPSGKYLKSTIQGSLTVNNGATVIGVTNYIGSAQGQPASLTVDGAGSVYGECTKNNTSKTYTFITNALGGKILLKNGGAFKCYSFDIKDEVTADPSTGYIDVMEVDGSTTWTSRERRNYSSDPARIVVKSGTLTCASVAQASYRHFRHGPGKWVLDLAENAGVRFNGGNRDYEYLSESTTVEFVGEGDVEFSSEGKTINFRETVSFGHTGTLHFNNTSVTIPSAGVAVTNRLKLLKMSKKTLTCDADLRLNAIESDASGVFTGSGSITMGIGDADATITGDIGAESTLSFNKVGSGELSLSSDTTRLASLNVGAGSVRVRGGFASPSLTVAAGARIIVDGTTWTIDGSWFSCAGSLDVVNGGSLVVKTAAGNEPVFASGSRLTVSEYWIDGVKQERGEYSLGGATINVAPPWSEDGLTTWTNDDAGKTDWAFSAYAAHLGLSFVSPATALSLVGGDLTLGSGGIAVDSSVTSDCAYYFNLPMSVGVSQTWDFGPAAVVIGRGISVYAGTTVVPKLIVEANSTGANAPAVTFAGGSCEPELELAVPVNDSDRTAPVVRFAANTDTVFRRYAAMPSDNGAGTRYLELQRGAIAEFAGGARFVNRHVLYLDDDSQLILRGMFKAGRYDGNRGFNAKKKNAGGSVLFDVSEISYEVGGSIGYKFAINLPWVMARDYSFVKGWVDVGSEGVVNLAGHPQKLEKVTGSGMVTSYDPVVGDALPAVVEFDYANEKSFTNSLTFAGGAGFRKLGSGTVVLEGDSTGSGDISVEAGEAYLGGLWTNVVNVSVTGGILGVGSSGVFGRQAEVHLTGSGVLSVPVGRTLRVAKLWVPDPQDPTKEVALPDGCYDAASTSGRIVGGMVRAGELGCVISVR